MTTGKEILVSAGGIIVNVISATILWMIVELNYLHPYLPIRGYIIHSYLIAVFTMIPQVYADGTPNDGKHIMNLLRVKRKQ